MCTVTMSEHRVWIRYRSISLGNMATSCTVPISYMSHTASFCPSQCVLACVLEHRCPCACVHTLISRGGIAYVWLLCCVNQYLNAGVAAVANTLFCCCSHESFLAGTVQCAHGIVECVSKYNLSRVKHSCRCYTHAKNTVREQELMHYNNISYEASYIAMYFFTYFKQLAIL
jgi:hypothetical protein